MRTDRKHLHASPTTAMAAPLVGTFVLVAVFRSLWPTVFSIGGFAVAAHRARNDGITLTPHAVEVTAVARPTKTIPWTEVGRIRRGSWWRGGTVFETTSLGAVWSSVPSTWWGPANREQLAEIERWWLEHRGAGADPAI